MQPHSEQNALGLIFQMPLSWSMAPIYGRLDHGAFLSACVVPEEANRVRIPRRIPEEFLSPTAVARTIVQCTWTGRPPAVIQFSRGDGIRLWDVMFCDPQDLQLAGLDYYRFSDISRTIWLHISWPGYRNYTHTTPIDHDGTYGSIAFGVACAYCSFLVEARNWVFEPGVSDDPLWDVQSSMYPNFDLSSLRLMSLVWVSRNIFQAEVDYVLYD
ncbi:hypothetical protein C8Q74DRAFT_522971 [Fomes fomentarius]|nr:hypothetical protein C8Q74DRAFT_522971 [Fomes fomentarius]